MEKEDTPSNLHYQENDYGGAPGIYQETISS